MKIMDISICEGEAGAYADIQIPARGASPGQRKYLSIEDLVTALDTSAEIKNHSEEFSVNVGLIPANLYSLKIEFEKDTGVVCGRRAFFKVPAKKRLFKYELRTDNPNVRDKGETMIPFPNLMFEARERKGHTAGLCVYAYKGSMLGPDTELYRYPFGNVGRDASVCMGGFSMDVSDLYGLDAYVQAFFDLRTNDDLYTGNSNASGLQQIDLIKKLSDMDEFPTELLSPAGKRLKEVF